MSDNALHIVSVSGGKDSTALYLWAMHTAKWALYIAAGVGAIQIPVGIAQIISDHHWGTCK